MQPRAGRQAGIGGTRILVMTFAQARAFYFLAERPQLDADMHFKHALPVLPTNHPTNRKKRSKGACLLALMWRALKYMPPPKRPLGLIRQIRPTLDSAASRYAILDALCAARQCQARRLASHRPSVDRSWVESIAEQNCGDGRQRSRGQALLNNLCNTKWPCSTLIKGPYVHCSTHDLTPF